MGINYYYTLHETFSSSLQCEAAFIYDDPHGYQGEWKDHIEVVPYDVVLKFCDAGWADKDSKVCASSTGIAERARNRLPRALACVSVPDSDSTSTRAPAWRRFYACLERVIAWTSAAGLGLWAWTHVRPHLPASSAWRASTAAAASTPGPVSRSRTRAGSYAWPNLSPSPTQRAVSVLIQWNERHKQPSYCKNAQRPKASSHRVEDEGKRHGRQRPAWSEIANLKHRPNQHGSSNHQNDR